MVESIGVFNLLILRNDLLPEPMLFPKTHHLFNRNSLRFRQEQIDEYRHDSNPTGEKQENPEPHST